MMCNKYGLNPRNFGFKAVFLMLEGLREENCIPK
jgi:hypothetical protein